MNQPPPPPSHELAEEADARPAPSAWLALLDVVLVWIVFSFAGAWPVPDVNEAHYLAKARHYWEPNWIVGDSFLDSRDSHVVFFSTFGIFAHWFSLPTAALVGRLTQWFCLAWGWRRLSYAAAPQFGFAALSAATAIACIEHLHMAGEWIVGGFEAKAFAYALMFSGLADLVGRRWNRGLIQFGAASAFHVLVGGWSVVAAGLAWLMLKERPHVKSLLPGLTVGGILALAGLIPALALQRGILPETAAEADRIYVFQRLPHHLVPNYFGAERVLKHLALWTVWAAWCAVRPTPSLRFLRRFVAATGLLAVVGTFLSFSLPEPSATGAALLRFYWFRLSDVLPGVGLALEIAAAAVAASSGESSRAVVRNAFALLLAIIGSVYAWELTAERRESTMPRGERLPHRENLATWRDVCRWIRMHTKPEDRFFTPKQFATFKWHAERAEFVTWKDVPQDAASIVEWKRKLDDVFGSEHLWFNYMPLERIRQLAARYEIDYLVTYREPPLAFPKAYKNNDFVVYSLSEARAESPPSP